MKKKILLLFLLLLSASTYAEWQGIIIGTRISMYVSFNHDEAIKGNMPQSPAPTQIPTVSIDGRTLYFYDVFSSTVPVVIVDSNDEVVFSDYLYCGADKIMLPASLTGTFTVYMRVGTILYYGNFIV